MYYLTIIPSYYLMILPSYYQAMKMEFVVAAPSEGTLLSLLVASGDLVRHRGAQRGTKGHRGARRGVASRCRLQPYASSLQLYVSR